jgi:hypothetical protein
MESVAAIKSPKAVRTAHSARGRMPVGTTQNVEKTPESELMTVEEYFDEVWQRYLEKYEKLQA